MAYDKSSQKTVLFGGIDVPSGTYYGDTWVFDWTSLVWRNVTPAPGAPTPCARHSTRLVYDGKTGKVLLFGGNGDPAPGVCPHNGGEMNDTWLWDGVQQTWTPCAAPTGCTNTQPTARESVGMALDSNSQSPTYNTVIMFGGNDVPATPPSLPIEFLEQAPDPLGDTWQWVGNPSTGLGDWTQLSPGTSPCVRASMAMAYDADSHRKQILGFGGNGFAFIPGPPSSCGTSRIDLDETWLWTGTTWSQCTTCNPQGIAPRTGHRLDWDAATKTIVLFAGITSDGAKCPPGSGPTYFCNDTWYIDGGSWRQKTPVHVPTVRCCHGVAYDTAHQKLLMFGGGTGTARTSLDDTWYWNGNDWIFIG